MEKKIPENQISENDKTELSLENEAYSQICNTASTSIRWLVFAIAVCSGVTALCLATFYFGNLNYAIERRETIQKACWECDKCEQMSNSTANSNSNQTSISTHNSNSNQTSISTPTNTTCQSCSNEKNTNSIKYKRIDACDKLDENENRKIIDAYKEFIGKTRTVSLPIVNLTLVTTDFVIIVILIGMFFWFWLWHTLKFTRGMLCSFYNKTLFSESKAHTISNYFLLLWSGGARKSFSNISQYIFLGFLITIILVIVSDFIDNFSIINQKSGVAISFQPGWESYSNYFVGKTTVEFSLLMLGVFLFLKTRNLIVDIRNLLILMEWSDRSLYPMLRNLFIKLKVPLVDKGNEVSYEEEDSKNNEFGLRFRLNFSILKNEKEKKSEKGIVFSAPIDLSKKAKEFSKRPQVERKAPDWMLNESEKRGILTTFEERRMRRFFYEILVNEKFGGKLSNQFYSKLVKELAILKKSDLSKNQSETENTTFELKILLIKLIDKDIESAY